MKQVFTLLFALVLFSCNSTNNTENKQNQTALTTKKKTEKLPEFDFENFKIRNGQLGSIKIGMTINQAEMQFNGLRRKMDEAINFGFGGGSPAYLYYSGDELVFGLIPKLETDTILYIIAAHKEVKSTNGLNPKSTVEELLVKYPEMTIQQDLMNDWEVFQDPTNRWKFIFMTEKETEIGEYPKLEMPSKPKRLTTKADCIVIR